LTGATSTGDGIGHRWGTNGEFCVVVCPATKTADILAEVKRWLLIRAGHSTDMLA